MAPHQTLVRAVGPRIGRSGSGLRGGGSSGVRVGSAAVGSPSRVEVTTSAESFLEFVATQKRRKCSGPGRTAAHAKRWLMPDEAAAAMRGGKAAQRAAYAWAYGLFVHEQQHDMAEV